MSPNADKLLHESLKLSELDRAEIAAQLLGSLDPDSDDIDPEDWDAEIARRIREVDDGKVRCIPWNEAREIIVGMRDEPQS